jgi:oligoribonuclease NrnB/cAMP/cGMP phosphodiesterase (DHH superfamily)
VWFIDFLLSHQGGKMTLRILHHNDPDGYASAYIVFDFALKSELVNLVSEIKFHSMAYGQPVPVEIDYSQDRVIMVDFSLQPLRAMEEFAARFPVGQFIWIDHHQTSIDMEELSSFGLKDIPGIREVSDKKGRPTAACELTWQFFFPGEDLPPGIEMLGGWDTWRYVKEEDSRSKFFIQYCNSINCTPYSQEGQTFWENILLANDNPHDWLYENVLREGEAIDRFRTNDNVKRIKGSGFAGKFGGYSAIMVNDAGGSLLFEGFKPAPSEVDLMVAFKFTKNGYFTVSLYSVQEHIDCGAIAKKLGEAGPIPSGGGHKGAAGFQCNWSYLESIIERNV